MAFLSELSCLVYSEDFNIIGLKIHTCSHTFAHKGKRKEHGCFPQTDLGIHIKHHCFQK